MQHHPLRQYRFRAALTKINRIFADWNDQDFRQWILSMFLESSPSPYSTETDLGGMNETMGYSDLVADYRAKSAGRPGLPSTGLRSKFWKYVIPMMPREKLYLILANEHSYSELVFHRFLNAEIVKPPH